MDAATVAATAIGASLPYLITLGKEGAKAAAGAAGKSVWEWVKGKLSSAAGKEAVRDLEANPADTTNRRAVEVALSKLLRNDSSATSELRSLLIQAGAMSVRRNITVTATNGSVAAGGNIIGSTITTESQHTIQIYRRPQPLSPREQLYVEQCKIIDCSNGMRTV